MENVQPYQILVPIGMALLLGIVILIWGDRPELAAAIRARFAERVADDMSTPDAGAAPAAAVAPAPATTTTQAGQRIAMRNNADNAALPDNVALPEDARAIVRFHAQVEAVIAVVETGKIGQTEAIERIFRCSRSSKPESVYAQARDAVVARRQRAAAFRPLDPEQRALREELGLPQ